MEVWYMEQQQTSLKFDNIQFQALRLCTGAFKTSTAALQVEMGEMPLALQQVQLSLNYSITTQIIPLNTHYNLVGRRKKGYKVLWMDSNRNSKIIQYSPNKSDSNCGQQFHHGYYHTQQ